MTELRKRMIEDMELAGLVPSTQRAYIKVVRQLAAHFNLSPDRLSERQPRDYVIHLRDVRAVAKGTFQQHFLRIKFLFVNCIALSSADRRQIVLMILRKEEPLAVLSRRFNVSETALYRWKDDFLAAGEEAPAYGRGLLKLVLPATAGGTR